MPKAEKQNFDDIKLMSFEDGMKELEAIVRRMEGGSQDLDASLGDYARGAALKTHCEQKLREARMKVEKIVADGDGVLTTEALDPQ